MWIQTKYYVGRYVEYDNVYVIPGYRGKEVGKKMIIFVNHYARGQKYVAAELNYDITSKGNRKFGGKLGLNRQGSATLKV